MFWPINLCRICGQIAEISHPIFVSDAQTKDITVKIKKCLNLDVYRDDYKPKEICAQCLLKLNDFYDFIGTCQGANEKFDAMLYEYEDANKRWPGRASSSQKSGVIVPSKGDSDGLGDCSDIIMMVQYKENNFLPLETLESLNEQDMLNVVSTVENNYARKKQDGYQQNQTVLRHSGDVHDRYYSEQIQKEFYYTQPQQNIESDNVACNFEAAIFGASAYACMNNNVTNETNKKKSNKALVSVEEICKSVKPAIEKSVKNKTISCTQHKTTKLYSCSSCDKKFHKKVSLDVHMSTHTNIRPYVCHVCSKSFAVQWELTSHKKIHSGAHKCQFCSKTFAVQSKLERHERIHRNERPFVCKFENCDKQFSDKRNLIAHELMHSGVRGFECDVCRKSYKTKSHLNDHKRAHETAAFKCEFCGVVYKWKASLLMHVKKHKGYVCLSCKKDCGKLSALIKHRKLCGNKKK